VNAAALLHLNLHERVLQINRQSARDTSARAGGEQKVVEPSVLNRDE